MSALQRDASGDMIRHVALAPGASGNAAAVRPYLDALAGDGLAARLIALPRGSAERAVPVYRSAAPPSAELAIGGQSFGGRVASLLAAGDAAYGALLLICYPLHPPGRHDQWEARTAHWQAIDCPVLLLSGDRDPFARVDLLRRAVPRLPNAELVIFPGIGHGLGPVRARALEAIRSFLGGIGTPPLTLPR